MIGVNGFNDCRALSENDFQKFFNGDLSPFVELVKKHDELELCFRGNDKNPCVCIYYNNHVIFKIHVNGIIVISFNHARYSKCWKTYYEKLKEAGFKGSIRNLELKENRRNKEVAKQITVGNMTANKQFTVSELEKIYKDILLKIFIKYFKVAGNNDVADYFKFDVKGDSGCKVNVPDKLEKVRQQALFTKMKFIKNGYFFYDMEFAQKHKSKDERDQDKKYNNQADMLAIKFNNNQKPEKIVLVEVKCKKASLYNDSGIKKHLEKMEPYIKTSSDKEIDKRKEQRRIEAWQIMNQYATLGLRGLSTANIFDYDNDFKKLDFQILLVFTDNAIDEWHKNFSKTIEDYKLEKQDDNFISSLNLGFKAEFWRNK